MKKLIFSAIIILLTTQTGFVIANELTSQNLDMILSWEADDEFQRSMETIFADNQQPKLNFAQLSSIVAIPVAAANDFNLAQLVEGEIIGALYLSSGSSSLSLPPGHYWVNVVRIEDGSWRVVFLDDDNTPVADSVARVTETDEAVERPLTAVDHSVCYRADSWEVCF